ncbi:MAG TPA: helix-turn-helix domain-containing protein [Baekduia sp.]|nr:helix-turn-helix domain-containing protein [Baekduia sp.]
MLDRGLISVQEAAEQLGVTPSAVRQHVVAGRLPAVKRGGAWWLDGREVARMRRRPPGAGRPLSDQMAWAVILFASGEPLLAQQLAARDRYVTRAKAWVRVSRPLADYASRLRARANVEEFDAHPAEVDRIVERPDVLRTGISAGELVGLTGGRGAEIYAPAAHRDEIVKRHALDPGAGPVRLRWVRDELWPVIQQAGDRGRAPRVAALLDLLESDDPRARREAAKALGA